MKLRSIVVALSTALATGGVYAQTSSPSAQDALNDGIAAFKQARYSDAAKNFNTAKQQGLNDAHIEYNLGVTYVKLEKFDQAKEIFLSLSKLDNYRQVSHYNLGLICKQQKDNLNALVWFRRAAEKNGNKNITALANRMISKVSNTKAVNKNSNDNALMPVLHRDFLGGINNTVSSNQNSNISLNAYNDPAAAADVISRGRVDRVESLKAPTTDTKKGKVSGGITLAYGHDTNPEVIGGQDAASTINSNYSEVFGFVNVPITGSLTGTAEVYKQSFEDVNSDFASIDVGLNYRMRAGVWTITPAIHLVKTYSNGDDYQNITDFYLGASRSLGKDTWLALRLRYSDIDTPAATPTTDFTDERGSRTQLRADYLTKISYGRVRLRYEYETNDRSETSTLRQDSVSPEKHTFKARLARMFSDKWEGSGELGFTKSTYEGSNGDREDDKTQLRLDVNYKMRKDWTIGAQFVNTKNSSNLPLLFEYDKQDYQIYTNWTF